MAINIYEKFSGESSGAQGDLKTGTREYSRYFTAVVTAGEKPGDIRAHEDLPQIGDAKPGDLTLRVRRVLVRAISPIMSEVEVQYESPGPNQDDSPIDLRPDIQTGHAKIEEPIDEDIHGKPIATACGEPYANITKPIPISVFTITRNMPSFNYMLADEYVDAVNADPFLGFPPGRCKIEDITSVNVYDGDFEYWRVTAEIHARKRGKMSSDLRAWWLRVRHEGFYELVVDILQNRHKPIGYSVVRALDDRGEPMAAPVSLNDDGQRETDLSKGHFKEYEIHQSKPYNVLGLL